MDPAVSNRLIELNRQFYQMFGREFSSTRSRLQPGARRILEMLNGTEHILDLGCGNGRLARELVHRGHKEKYLGLDFSSSLIEEANDDYGTLSVRFMNVDMTSKDWEHCLGESPSQRFEVVFAFAVLHHVPGNHLRLGILKKVHTLLKPGGRFIHSEWQFLNSPRLRARVQQWEGSGVTAAEVDPGDYLLDWRRGGRGLRYVHFFEEIELIKLASGSGFYVIVTFFSDGEGGKLGLYQVWERKENENQR